MIKSGDKPGHEFHGNQWTNGAGKTEFAKSVKKGSRIHYDDGRPGHAVGATVLHVGPESMVVQFDDRADTTTIHFNDEDWMKYLSIKSRDKTNMNESLLC